MIASRHFICPASTNVTLWSTLVCVTLVLGALTPLLCNADNSLDPGDVLVVGRDTVLRIDRFGVQATFSNGKAYDDPRALAIDANGDILLGAQVPATQVGSPGLGGAIIQINPATQKQTIVSSGGSLSIPTGIVIDPNGDLLVADAGSNAVIRIDRSTGIQTVLSSGGAFSELTGIALESNGQILVTNDGPSAVIQVDPATGAQTVISLAEPSLNRPTGIVVEASGDLLVTNEVPTAVVRVNPATGTQTVLTTEGNLIVNGQIVQSLIKWPVGVALEATGDILVLSRGSDNAVRLDRVTLSQSLVASPFESPRDIAVAANGDIFVADGGRRSRDGPVVFRIDPATGQDTLVSRGNLFFSNLIDITVEASGDVLTTSAGVIVRLDAATGAPTVVSAGDDLRRAWGIALDQGGDIFVTTGNEGGVLRVDPLTGTRTIVSPSETFAFARSLVVEGDGNLLVVDRSAASIVRLDPGTGTTTVVSSGGNLSSPEGITLDTNGDILVVNSHAIGAAIRIDPTTGTQTIVSSARLLDHPRDIAIDANGDLLVVDSEAAAVILIDPVSGSQLTVSAGGGLSSARSIAIVPLGESPFVAFTPDRGPVSLNGRMCIRSLNKSLAKVAQAQARDNLACIKKAAKGNLGGTVEDCIVADLRGKVAKAMARTVSAEAKSCTGNPFTFGATDSATVNDVGMRRGIDLIRDTLGPDLDAAVIPKNKRAAGCQQRVVGGVDACHATMLKAFNACVKTALRTNTADTRFRLENCIGNDPKRKIARRCDPETGKLRSSIVSHCGGVDLSDAFGSCDTDDATALARCLNTSINCRLCLGLNQADALSRDCDEFDDGVVNSSCSVAP